MFRDDASLSANPALWQSLETALQQSEWFILLASPAAAASPWVVKEVEFWCAHRVRERLLIVLTGGEVHWDLTAGDFSWSHTNALPAVLRGAFVEEPRFVDLRWARSDTDISLANPRFADAVADIAAAVQNKPKDELLGEDVRQHHRTRRVVAGTITVLTALLIGAVAASIVAVRQRDRAEMQARTAMSRLLAATAQNSRDDQLDIAFRLAAQAWAYQDNAQTRGSLVQTLLRSPHLIGFLPDTVDTTVLGYAPATDTFAVGSGSGVVTLWDGTTRRRIRSLAPARHASVASLAFDDAGEHLVVGHVDGVVQLWNAFTGEREHEWSVGAPVMTVAFSRAASMVAAATDTGELQVWRARDGARLHHLRDVSYANPRIDLAEDGTLTVGDGQGNVKRWILAESDQPMEGINIGAGMPFVAAYTKDLRRYAGQTGGNTPYVVDVHTGDFLHRDNLVGAVMNSDAMAFSDDGAWLATAGAGLLQVWDVGRNTTDGAALGGVLGRATAIAFGRGGDVVAVAGERGVGLWHRHAHGLMQTFAPQGAQPASEVPRVLWGAASVVFSPDGARVAWSINTSAQSWVTVWDIASGVEVSRVGAEWVLGFSADGEQVLSATDIGKGTLVTDIEIGTSRAITPSAPNRPPEDTAAQPWTVESRQRLGASIAADGTLTLWDVSTRQAIARANIPGATDRARLAFDPAGRRLAVAPPGGVLTLIDTDLASWRAGVCSRAARPLTEAEWMGYVGERLAWAPEACPAEVVP